MARRLSAKEWKQARALWENDGTLSLGDVASRFGTTKTTLHSRIKRHGWERSEEGEAAIRRRAQERADAETLTKNNKAYEDVIKNTSAKAQKAEAERDALAAQLAEAKASEKHAVSELQTRADQEETQSITESVREERSQVRGEVLSRHRQEAALPRRLAYEAVKSHDFEKAKLAKITSETILNIHKIERQAYGLDTDEQPRTIVIERT
jgi:hypothetical protein